MSFGKALLLFFLVIFIGAPIYGYVSHQKSVAARKLAAEQGAALVAETAKKAKQTEQDREEQRLASIRQAQIEQGVRDAAALESAGRIANQEAISSLQAITSAALKDPSSAQFRGLELKSGGAVLCGEVNAKNSFGGYVGFRPFVTTEAGTAIWNGGCSSTGDIDSRIACHTKSLAYIDAARGECKSQQEINATLLQAR